MGTVGRLRVSCGRRSLLIGGVLLVSVAAPAAATPSVAPVILHTFPHDTGAFTEGLVLRGGQLFESTGLEGASSLRRVDRGSGQVLQSVDLDPSEFGEGLAFDGTHLIQLTWKNGVAHLYDPDSFAALGSFRYSGEGWGLCYDGARLVMSDGSDQLFFRDPATFELSGSQYVRDDGNPVVNLNELECVGGEVFANVWLTNEIVRIDPSTGIVLTRIDASALRAAETAPGADVLNGIAYDDASDHFLLTGKLWSTLFEVELPHAAAAPPDTPHSPPASCALTVASGAARSAAPPVLTSLVAALGIGLLRRRRLRHSRQRTRLS